MYSDSRARDTGHPGFFHSCLHLLFLFVPSTCLELDSGGGYLFICLPFYPSSSYCFLSHPSDLISSESLSPLSQPLGTHRFLFALDLYFSVAFYLFLVPHLFSAERVCPLNLGMLSGLPLPPPFFFKLQLNAGLSKLWVWNQCLLIILAALFFFPISIAKERIMHRTTTHQSANSVSGWILKEYSS